MERSDRLILKSFLCVGIPNDFYDSVQKIIFIDSLLGYVDSLLHKKVLFRHDIEKFMKKTEDDKKCITYIISKSQDNLQFYYMIKLVIGILLKYSVE